jgi:oxygen-independent coproporphyrinogen III oxidase
MTHISQLAEFGLFDARVPRYTSYPTAPHFSNDVGQADYISWIKGIAPNSEISLYMHVPFCRRLCWFCACRTQGTTSDAPVQAYAKTLLAEINMLRAHLPKGVRLSRLHWGGGTPTLMPAPMITQIGQAILQMAPMADGGEFSVEIDPNEIDAARLRALADLGMNRASIGVQDFDPEVQAAIGRIQPFYLTRQVAAM